MRLNLYIVKTIALDIPMSRILQGVIPFIVIEVPVIILVAIWPELALWLPNKVIGWEPHGTGGKHDI
ncbi:MAG: hypothetical protein AMJ54_15805 [Deltaproteobacteria bacterium SG8_13]|nr:MAG: hypothetical protein AMJ54_15805 [Deltaproteobacteria bacterium SG8_13]